MIKANQTDDHESVKKPIVFELTKSIFQGDQGGENLWVDDERLSWISNYEPGKVIFITNINVWQLEYRHFTVDASSKRIYYNISSSENYKFSLNYLLKGLKEAVIVPSSGSSVIQPTEPTKPTAPLQTGPTTKSTASIQTDHTDQTTRLTSKPLGSTEVTMNKTTEESKLDKKMKQSLIVFLTVLATVVLVFAVLAFVYYPRRIVRPVAKRSTPAGGKVAKPKIPQINQADKEKKSTPKEKAKDTLKRNNGSKGNVKAVS